MLAARREEGSIPPPRHGTHWTHCTPTPLHLTHRHTHAAPCHPWQEATQVAGSSTACLAVLRAGGILEVANVGDSGLRIVRGAELAFQTQVCPARGAWHCAVPRMPCAAPGMATTLHMSLPLEASRLWMQSRSYIVLTKELCLCRVPTRAAC